MSLTKDDLKQIKGIVTEARMATKADLDKVTAKFATKADLDRMETRITSSMSFIERDAFTRLDQHEIRIAKLEQKVAQA